jgi:hypothetical protein
MQTVSKSYVDTAIAVAISGHPLDDSPYVLKAGDTMTGPLVLPGDPVSANQASDKNYVDEQTAAVEGGISGKVALNPSVTQVVNQPVGTDLETSRLNGVEYASHYATGGGNNGIANAAASTDCTGARAAGVGCLVTVEPGVAGIEEINTTALPNSTHVRDLRLGAQRDVFSNPRSVYNPATETAEEIDLTSTESTQAIVQQGNGADVQSIGLSVNQSALTGGSNLYPEGIETPPYFKTNYLASSVSGTFNTPGQHGLDAMTMSCYGVGDCLVGSRFQYSSGGFIELSDEGTHPFDLSVQEDSQVFSGVCSSGCTSGSQSVMVGSQINGKTQGEGRYLIDKNPAQEITSGHLTGGSNSGLYPAATFTGTTFPVSTFFATAALIPSQARNMAPGTVTFAIATTGVPSGYATNTASAPAPSGIACVVDPQAGRVVHNYEMAPYTVVDGTHLQMTLAKPHGPLAAIAIGGLCGYGLEQTVDTANGLRQVFPVVGSYSSTGLYYAGALSPIVGFSGQTSSYANLSQTIVSAVRNSNVVTLTLSPGFSQDVNGLNLTVTGMTDSSYNGTFQVSSTGNTTLTYPETGANSTSSGGTVGILTGGYVLYPMAETVGVYDAATQSVDGLLTLAPNTVAWAPNDPVEQPHYFQVRIGGDTQYMSQTMPRPVGVQYMGYEYDGNNGPGLQGFKIANTTPASNYFGNGGTHSYPATAYVASGIWNKTFLAQAGEQALFSIGCNSKGCNRWNSGYNVMELASSAGTDLISYQPQTSYLTFSLRGAGYQFTPLAFTASTADITTLNATTVNASTVNLGTVTATSLASTGALSGSALTTGAIVSTSETTGALSATSETVTGTSTSGNVNTGTVTATTLNGALAAGNIVSGTIATARLPLMGASGTGHAAGIVPDPGATAGTSRYLREDGTWVSPAGGVTTVFGRTGAVTASSGDYSVAQVTGAAPLASPAFTGTPTAPTQATTDSSTAVATDAFVKNVSATLAPLASPALTGAPTAPTASTSDTSTRIATDAFTHSVVTASADPIGAAGSTSVYVTVAASNSVNKANANYVATGTGDQTTINAAINTCSATLPASSGPAACRVVLMPGVYNLSGSVVINTDDVMLAGQQHCMWGGYNHEWTGTSSAAGAISTGCSQLRASSSGFDLVTITHTVLAGTGVDTGRHRGIGFSQLMLVGYNFNNNAISNGTGNADDGLLFDDLMIMDTNGGIVVFGDAPTYHSLNIQGISGTAINSSGYFGRISDSIFYDIGGSCVMTGNPSMVITNITCGDTQGYGVYGSGNHLVITSNAFQGNVLGAIHLLGSRASTISGNNVNDWDNAYSYNVGVNGYFPNAASAIYVDPSSAGTTIADNVIDAPLPAVGIMTGYAIQDLGPSGVVGPNTILGCWSSCGAGQIVDSSNTTIGNTYASTSLSVPVLTNQYKAANVTGVSSGAAIASVPDSGGRSQNVASCATGPTYIAASTINSGPAMRYSGTVGQCLFNNNLTIPVVASARTVFSVVNMSALPATAGHYYTITQSTTQTEITSSGPVVGTGVDITTGKPTANGGVTILGASALAASTTYVIETKFNGSNTQICINGTCGSLSFGGNQTWVSGLYIGSDNGQGSGMFEGDIAEVDIYDGTMAAATTGALATEGAALCSTYGVTCGSSW